MDSSDQRRKRKRSLKPTHHFFSLRSLLYFFSFFAFFFILFRRNTPSFHHVVVLPGSSTSSSIHRLFSGELTRFKIDDRVLFPDHILILLSGIGIGSWNVVGNGKGLECVYRNNYTEEEEKGVAVLSVDEYNDIQWLVRCPLPPTNFSSVVTLRSRGAITVADTTVVAMNSWENLAYEAVLDGNTAVVFVKGISHRQDKASDPNRFRCHFGFGNQNYILTSKALTAAQEVVRCALPKSLEIHPEKSQGIRATVSFQLPMRNHHHRTIFVPSVAKLSSSKFEINTPKHDLCVCTMLWNQADSIREWITYHSWLGVQKWFIYDNNSDDGIESVINKLDLEGFNVSRHVWPWIKTQEAGFSHCAIKAKNECNWVSFMDVDEFYYFPNLPGRDALRTLVSNYTSSPSIGELRTRCRSFGPSGLRSPPKNGVTVGYTCRLQRPERHKSIVRPEALDTTLMNVVHHFHLREGFRFLDVGQNTAVINHYKYQVWEAFRAKFYRRVATYVADWKDSQNEGSRDRAPGLGTEPIEPADWRLRFCEVWDTGLRDVVLANLDDVLSRGRYLGGIDI
ncbi:glycosyltransferase family 92 protein RCOM_0530710 [Lactuca sativa]|uniref:Glycosyltransferase family 92 protein n=1 Tax=Lactuca sativa TaxID=4236 RepID=A0A9R1USH9_LACSA|nr:glycosyltransferase family 92 protein RCOM_0530710 [Lactuca sativa]KAJ0192090.1 hypothetical protein LSAT_V11C800453010 [Lactuca sativa]